MDCPAFGTKGHKRIVHHLALGEYDEAPIDAKKTTEIFVLVGGDKLVSLRRTN